MAEEEIMVWRSAKQIAPAMIIRTELSAVSSVVVLDSLKLPTSPKLKTNSSVPKISPLMPASDSMRLIAKE